MKKLFLISVALLSLNAVAQNYFVENMRWEERRTTTSSPDFPAWTINNFLGEPQEIAGKTAFPLFEEYENDNAGLICYVCPEGNKVYSLNLANEWVLMYDFSLEPGNSVQVWSPANISQNRECQGPYNVECLGKETIETLAGPADALIVFEESFLDRTRKIYWIKGIGSSLGVTNNCQFELDGGSTRLIRASLDGTVLYEISDPSSVQNIENDSEGKEKYYTLQGVPVSDPKGMVIRVRDGKAVKTIVR